MSAPFLVLGCFNSMSDSYAPVAHASTLWVDGIAWVVGGLILNLGVLSNLRAPADGSPGPSAAKKAFFSVVAMCIVALLGVSWSVAPLLTAACEFNPALVATLAGGAMLVFSAQAALFQFLGSTRMRGVVALVASSAVLVGVMTIAKEELAFPMLCPPTKSRAYFEHPSDFHGY